MKEVQWIDPDFLAPKDAWDRLSMKEKAAMMKVAVQNGITNLSDIRAKYNEFAEGGPVDTDWSYNSWKRQVAEHKGIRPDEDNTYDYEAYFNKYPEEAWKMLKGDPTAHFSDEFKTVYHPTFSSKSIGNDGSIYSGVRNPLTNPQGLVGGTWSPDYHTFTMSPDGYRGPVSMDDRKSYLENAEDNGVVLRETDGSLPIYDGIVLPNVTVYGNKHAEGGNLFRGGGSIVSDKLVDMTIKEEGFNKQPEDIGDGKMTLGSGLTASKWHDLYRKRGNKWSAADNRMAVRQELSDRERWAKSNIPNWKGLPDSSKEALLMYKYNYDFNRANSPKLFAALEAGNLPEAARQMDATSKDPKFKKGLANRRKREQAHFMLGVRPTPTAPNDITLQSPDNTFVYNPYLLQEQNTTMLPQVVPNENAYVSTHEVSPEEIKAQKLQESFDNINRFNRTMEMLGNNLRIPTFHPTTGNDVLDLLWATRGNDSPLLQMADEYARGGKIYIKPSHRGRLTELKKRTGKSEAELYRTGSPATRKMITFARNARKWKHGLGGNLFSGEEDHSNQMNIGLNATNGWQPYTLGDIVANGERVARQRKALQDTFLNFPVESNDATAVAKGRPQNKHLEERAIDAAKKWATNEAAFREEHPILATVGDATQIAPFITAAAPAFISGADAYAGTTAGQGIYNFLTKPATEAAVTALFGGHGLHSALTGDGNALTAFELAPLMNPYGNFARGIMKAANYTKNNWANRSEELAKLIGKEGKTWVKVTDPFGKEGTVFLNGNNTWKGVADWTLHPVQTFKDWQQGYYPMTKRGWRNYLQKERDAMDFAKQKSVELNNAQLNQRLSLQSESFLDNSDRFANATIHLADNPSNVFSWPRAPRNASEVADNVKVVSRNKDVSYGGKYFDSKFATGTAAVSSPDKNVIVLPRHDMSKFSNRLSTMPARGYNSPIDTRIHTYVHELQHQMQQNLPLLNLSQWDANANYWIPYDHFLRNIGKQDLLQPFKTTAHKYPQRRWYASPNEYNAESNAYRVVDDYNGRRDILDPLDEVSAGRFKPFKLTFDQAKSLWELGYKEGGYLNK